MIELTRPGRFMLDAVATEYKPMNGGSDPWSRRGSVHSFPTPHIERFGDKKSRACLIVNADDWGRDEPTTDSIHECLKRRSVSSVSAMVFMEDSERAACMAREAGIDAGLHLNLTTPFSLAGTPGKLMEHQRHVSQYLRRHRLAQVLFHPGLTGSFAYLVAAQIEAFRRLYGAEPNRIDGHHHMHLCANVVLGRLLPAGTVVRRNFSFLRREKSPANRLYRRAVDAMLARRHRLADFFFSLAPVEPAARLQEIFSLARQFVVEVETHPIKPAENRFLATGEIFCMLGDLQVASRYAVADRGTTQ